MKELLRRQGGVILGVVLAIVLLLYWLFITIDLSA